MIIIFLYVLGLGSQLSMNNSFLVSIVYTGSVWMCCKSLTEFNKVLTNPNSGPVVIGFNLGILFVNATFLGKISELIIRSANTE